MEELDSWRSVFYVMGAEPMSGMYVGQWWSEAVDVIAIVVVVTEDDVAFVFAGFALTA